jgi:hypothetical protein
MAEYMPWIIMVVIVFGTLAALVVAIVVLARLGFEQSTKIGELSMRKPFYLLQIEKGSQGVRKVVRMEPDVVQQDEGIVPLGGEGMDDPLPYTRLDGMNDDYIPEVPDQDSVALSSRMDGM